MAKGLKIAKDVLTWRKKQKPQSIMKTSTFNKIESGAEKGGLSEERAKKVAGSAYWNTVLAKFRERRKAKGK